MSRSWYGTMFGTTTVELHREFKTKFEDDMVDIHREETEKPKDYCDNRVITSKYNVFTFLPRSLFEQFRRVANLYFLFISILMLIGTYTTLYDSPITPYSTLITLVIVLAISMTKEAIEDTKRHKADKQTNHQTTLVLNKYSQSEEWTETKWKDVKVGNIVKVIKNQEIPADLILLTTSEKMGVAFIETSNIDGETNLKIKNSCRTGGDNGPLWTVASELRNSNLTVQCEQPNSAIHHFNGTLFFSGREVGVDASSLLLRGSSLRNTKHAIGIVVYTGKETKLVMNSRKAPSKLSYIEKTMNTLIYMIFAAQVLISLVSLIAFIVFKNLYYDDLTYLCYNSSGSTNSLFVAACDSSSDYSDAGYFITFFILYNNFIPISLYVTVEMCNYFQAFFIDNDLQLYHNASDTPALARTSNMNSDLGMVEYIFSDKTGTLTDNVMKFKRCSIAGTVYGDSPFDEDKQEQPQTPSDSLGHVPVNRKAISGVNLSVITSTLTGKNNSTPQAKLFADFVLVLALCHTVIVDTENTSNGGESQQQLVSESPDEEALVKAAQTLGMTFVGRSPGRVNLIHQQQSSGSSSSSSGGGGGVSVSYELLATIPFDSTRKRMSVVIRRPDGSLVVYCKGADNIIFERATHFVDSSGSSVPVSQSSGIRDTLVMHLDCFASDGLRTLVLAKKELSPDVYSEFSKIWSKAERSLKQRQAYMQQAAELVESGLTVMGATAIEDKLQQGVASTIADLRAAGIKLWVLTGDKMETAINIGYSSRLLMPNMILIKLAYKGEDTMSVRRKLGTLLHHFQTLAEEHSDFFKKWISRKKTFYQDINTGDGSTSAGGAAEEEGTGGAGGGEGGEGRENEPMFDPIQEGSPLLEKSSKAPSVGQITCDHLGLVVDGETLIRIFSDSVSEQLFLALSMICRSVIACRVSPEQKRLIVRMVQRGVAPTPVTLSIGDGANDVAMIQEAQIGVGISGKEGRQAVNNSDFAIAQFRFLRRLLLIHGRLDYRRICKVVEYSFYKNIVSTIVVFCFTFFSAYSGQSLFEDSIHAVYNVVLAWPVIGFGIFDRDISEKTLLQHNFLYLSGRKRLDLNIGTMLYSMLQAVLDGVIIYFVPYYVYRQSNDVWNSPDFNGYSAGLWVFGTTVYCCLMGAMFVKLYCMTCTWTWLSHLFYWGSIVLFIIFLIWYQYWIDWSYWYYGVTFEMASSSTFWYLLWLVPTASYLMSSTFVMVQKEFFPTVVDIGTEFDQDASSLPLLPSWLWSTTSGDASESDPLTGSKTLLPAEFDELMQTLLTIGSSKYIMDWENIKLYWSSFMASEQANLGLLNTSTTNRAESTFNFDHLASNYNSSASDSHVVHISAALLFPIQYVAKLAANSSIPSSSSAAASPAPFSSDSSEAVESKEDLKSII